MTSPSQTKLAPAVEKKERVKTKLLQYTGLVVLIGGREYSFRVAELDETDRFFTVSIGNADFLPGKLKYQEGPDICYRKLTTLLAEEKSDSPLCLRQQVSASEAADYAGAGAAKSRKWTDEQRLEARKRHNPWLP